MKVSLITVTCNSAVYLEDCIQSVLRQQYNNIEYIIIDGGSTDGTIEIIKKYEQHIANWISEKDGGMFDAINKGIALATGDIVGTINSDDIYASGDVISSIVECFYNYKSDAVYGDLVYVLKWDVTAMTRYWKGFAYKRFRFAYGWMPAHPTFYIRRKVLLEGGGYITHYFSSADYELMARYLYRYRISATYLPKLFIKMRVGGQSNLTLKGRLRANRRDYLAMKINSIPFPFLVSVLKPVIKMHQYYYLLFHKI